ncbi:nose resistant to fluoxetine protein 6-like [Vanessa cardui]|uniref:nose resistant to fluoxetine protein 6-like n=1 Tax=Vanessa cardui TaxID=171605 RepID=UPI001F146A1D|nr:nose resistant to fluoxetine protein 6-like [Vanessa cardui]
MYKLCTSRVSASGETGEVIYGRRQQRRQFEIAPARLSTMWRLVVYLVGTAAAKGLSEQDHFKLPQLYQLDNYDRCLSQPEGLYCLGTFRLTANKPNAAYNSLKEYSSEPRNFDRTLLHRGYCLSARCPSGEHNATSRFERCVEQSALAPGLSAALQSYTCTTPDDLRAPHTISIPQRAFIVVVCVILFLNAVGTLYDYAARGEGKNKLLMAWSVRANWNRLFATYEDGDPRLSALAPVQGIRVLLLALVMMTHASEILHKIYLYNPEFFEHVLQYSATMLVRNGSSLVQGFFVLSNFLFAYRLLLFSKQIKLKLTYLPLCIVYRLVRLSPVHLLVVGFAATWWQHSGDGPQWAATVGAESQVCSKKFWTHALYLNNFFYSEEHCLLQTWFLAVDMQLFIVASILMLYLLQNKKNPVPVLTLLFFMACLLNAGLAYINEWKSLLYIMVPENVRNTFRGIPSFNQFYTAPWGSLPSCLIGLLTAQIHFNMQEQGYKISKHKWFVWLTHMSIPLHVAWILAGNRMLQHSSRAATALYVAVERPVFAVLASMTLLGFANNVDNNFHRLAAWRGWAALGRMSLSVLMLHWVINMQLAATRRTLTEVTILNIGADLLSTWWWTYVAALPMTLLVEYPAQRTFTALLV